MGNEIAKYDESLDKIQEIVKRTNLVGNGREQNIKNSFQVAAATRQVRDLVTPEMMSDVMELQGSILGFKTDKDKNRDGSKGPGYPVEIVKECFIAMSFYGLQPTGNHWNIIAGNPYIAKEGMRKILMEIPGFDKFVPMYGVPKTGNGAVTVSCKATWEYNGQKQSIGFEGDECEIPVNPNNGTAVDQVLGKVERKFMKRVIERVAGCSSIPEGDVDEAAVKVGSAKTVDVKVSNTSTIDDAIEAEQSIKDKVQAMLKEDCKGNNQAMIAILEKFAGKKSMRGSKPDEYEALYWKICEGGSDRDEYIECLEAMGVK